MSHGPGAGRGPGSRAGAHGPRTRGHQAAYEELLGDIRTGARLHYDDPGEDPDLALLQGDERYAWGLSRLAELGDLAATAELADLISLVAEAHATGSPELAAALWEAGTVAVAWGASPAHEAAKSLARAGSPDAVAALRRAAEAAVAEQR